MMGCRSICCKPHPTSPRPSPCKGEGEIQKTYTRALENLLGEKNISGFSFISQQYDYEVQGSSVLKPLSGRGRINTDAQVFRPVLNSNKGVALSYSVILHTEISAPIIWPLAP